MNKITKIYIIALIIHCFLSFNEGILQGQEKEPKQADPIQYVLTRQGIIQEGIIHDRDQSIYIQFANGKGGFTISKLDILFIGQTKEDLLEYRRARIRPSDTAELLKLTDWAVRNQLFTPAFQMLKHTLESTTDYSSREILEKKIRQMEMIEKIRTDSLKKRTEIAPDPKRIEEERERIEWEKWSKSIPMTIQEQFIRKVQPVLLRRCGSSGCHSEADGRSLIIYQTGNGSPVRQNSLKNLAAILEGVDLDQTSSSAILSHSKIVNDKGIRVYPFGSDSNSLKDYENFVKWINDLQGKMKKMGPSPLQKIKDPKKSGSKSDLPQDPIPEAQKKEQEKSDSTHKAGLSHFHFQGPATVNRKAPPVKGDPNSTEEVYKRVGLLPTDIPKDIYDPILFNKKYH